MLSWILCGILFAVVIILVIKNVQLKSSMDEISMEFEERLSLDTNTLISISSNDRHVKYLASEINRQLRELRRQRRQYQSGNMELKNAVTNISHDLRTPLTAIHGYLDLIEQEDTSKAVERYLSIIKNRVKLLEQLTEELFHYSVIITTADNMEQKPVVFNRVLEESVAAFYTALHERNITPRIQMPDCKVIRNIDVSALSRVCSNLLSNAIKYSDGDLDITLMETGKIIFSNTASGLNEVQVGKLFDRFYTVEAARQSTGLGLAITRALVEQMHGTISAEYSGGRLYISIEFFEE